MAHQPWSRSEPRSTRRIMRLIEIREEFTEVETRWKQRCGALEAAGHQARRIRERIDASPVRWLGPHQKPTTTLAVSRGRDTT